jgi:hypothetical protein
MGETSQFDLMHLLVPLDGPTIAIGRQPMLRQPAQQLHLLKDLHLLIYTHHGPNALLLQVGQPLPILSTGTVPRHSANTWAKCTLAT